MGSYSVQAVQEFLLFRLELEAYYLLSVYIT